MKKFIIAAFALLLAGCGSCSTTCKEGITFYVAEVAGSLARGTSQELKVCFDGSCKTIVVSRNNVGGSIFVPFGGVAGSGNHHVTVDGTTAIHGDYKGKIESYKQVLDNGCGTCRLATIKIAADGSLTPAVSAQG
ncbi:MAG: hypothetical protein WCI10_01105 [Actinomycetota bacterium]|jgi:hypothetical protein